MLGWTDTITDLLNSLRQFVPIDRRAVTDGVIHATRLQRLPRLLRMVERGVEHREMGMQLRVERATAGVRERGGDQIAGDAVPLIALPANPGCGEGFEFTECDACCFLVRWNR
jgi:hypothetical protein